MYPRTNYHTAFNLPPGQQAASSSALSELERQSTAPCEKFQASGNAYAHGTRPNTMSHALSSSPNQYRNTAVSGWRPDIAIKSPYGYSWLPKEILQQPLQWIERDNESVPTVLGAAHDKVCAT